MTNESGNGRMRRPLGAECFGLFFGRSGIIWRPGRPGLVAALLFFGAAFGFGGLVCVFWCGWAFGDGFLND